MVMRNPRSLRAFQSRDHRIRMAHPAALGHGFERVGNQVCEYLAQVAARALHLRIILVLALHSDAGSNQFSLQQAEHAFDLFGEPGDSGCFGLAVEFESLLRDMCHAHDLAQGLLRVIARGFYRVRPGDQVQQVRNCR